MTYSQTPTDGTQALDDNQRLWRDQGYGVIDPGTGALEVTVNTGTLDATDTLSVAAGDVYSGNSVVSATSQNVGISSVSSTTGNTAIRFDTIWVDGTGTVQKDEGTVVELSTREEQANVSRFDAVTPIMPLPSTTPAVVVGAVVVTEDDGSVTASMVQDRRLDAGIEVESLTSASVDTGALNNEGDVLLVGTSGQLIERFEPSSSSTPIQDVSTTLDNSGGGTALWPGGVVKDPGPIRPRDGVRHKSLTGKNGAGATIWDITGGGKGIHLSSTAGTVRYGGFEGIRIRNADGLGNQTDGDSIAMHLEDSLRGFTLDVRFDDWANNCIKSTSPLFECDIDLNANNCDAGGQSSPWIFDFDNIGPGNDIHKVISYPSAAISGANSRGLRLAAAQEIRTGPINLGGSTGWAVQISGPIVTGPINYEPTDTQSTPDRVVHIGGTPTGAEIGALTVQSTTVNNVYNLNSGGAELPIPQIDNATINGDIVYVNVDTAESTTYQGNSGDVNNATGAGLTESVSCVGDFTQVS